jgi:hypothetical protein
VDPEFDNLTTLLLATSYTKTLPGLNFLFVLCFLNILTHHHPHLPRKFGHWRASKTKLQRS